MEDSSIPRRIAALLALALMCCGEARAQTLDSTAAPPQQSAAPKLDLSASTPSSSGRTPKLNNPPAKPHDSILSGIDLGGSTLNFEGDRKPPDTSVGAERFEPGTLIQSQKSRGIGPSFFGLSIKKTLD